MTALADNTVEAIEHFPCFGGRCMVRVLGSGSAGPAPEAALLARRRMESWHQQLSRFDPDSELSRLNRDPHETVAVSAAMALFVKAALGAAALTGGLVDPTLVGQLERAGYAADLTGPCLSARDAVALTQARRRATPNPDSRWREFRVDIRAGTVTRPPGVRLDSGGIAKGLVGDLLAAALGGHAAFAVDAAGDVRFGGTAGFMRPVQIASPFDDSVLHVIDLVRGAVATSGITKRSWRAPDGRAAHHILDPATGEPAFTGVVQVTALAPTGTEAEAISKVALLSGPAGAAEWLSHGGLIVYDDGSRDVIEPSTADLHR